MGGVVVVEEYGGKRVHSAVMWHLNRKELEPLQKGWGKNATPNLPHVERHLKPSLTAHLQKQTIGLVKSPPPPTRKKNSKKVSVGYGGGGGRGGPGGVGEGSLQWPRRTHRLNHAEADTHSGWAAQLWWRAGSVFHLFTYLF